MVELNKQEIEDGLQVITHIDDDTVRIWKVTDAHYGDDNDPLTTIVIDGTYVDMPEARP